MCEMPVRLLPRNDNEESLPLEAPQRPPHVELAESTMDTRLSLHEFYAILNDACLGRGWVVRRSPLWTCGFTIASDALEPLEPDVPTKLSLAIFQADGSAGLQIEVRPVQPTPYYEAFADELSDALGLYFRGGRLVMRPKK